MSGAARDFQIKVTSLDQTGPAFARVDKALKRFDEPIRKVNTGLSEVARASRFDAISSGFRSIGGELRGVSDLVTGLVPAFGALTAGGAIAGVFSMARAFSEVGAEIKRASDVLGVAEDTLQSYRGATELGGLDKANFDAAWQAFGDVLRQIQTGEDRMGALLLRKLGVDVPARGAPLTEELIGRTLDQVADALPRFDAVSRRKIAGMLGLTPLLAVLSQGADRLRELRREFDATNAAMTPEMTEAAKEADQSFKTFKATVDGLYNSIAFKLTPAAKGSADALSGYLGRVNQQVQKSEEGIGILTWPAQLFVNKIVRGGLGFDIADWIRGGPAVETPFPSTAPTDRVVTRAPQTVVSDQTGRLIIDLRVNSERGLSARPIIQNDSGARVEVTMQGADAP